MNSWKHIVQRTVEKRIPLSVLWEVTAKCNLSCIHCYLAHKQAEKELSTDEALDVLNRLRDMGAAMLLFTGGEIFTRPDALEILKTAARLGFAFKVFTNGTIADNAQVDFFREHPPVSVECSVYGTPQVHDHITQQNGSADQTWNYLKTMKSAGIRVTARMPVMKQNIMDVDLVRTRAGERDIPFIYDPLIIGPDNDPCNYSRFRLDVEQIQSLDGSAETMEFCAAENADARPQLYCNAGLNTFSISPCGDVYPCLTIRRNMGNVREQTLKQIWESDLFDHFRTEMLSSLDECARCSIRTYCNRCPGLALREGDGLRAPAPGSCLVAKARQRRAEPQRNLKSNHGQQSMVDGWNISSSGSG